MKRYKVENTNYFVIAPSLKEAEETLKDQGIKFNKLVFLWEVA
jgi:hypothetical protein